MPWWITASWDAVFGNSDWMVWNTFLALIPLALSIGLFRRRNPARTPLWWLGGLTFVAFLPNAPYVLTDVIHLVTDLRETDSIMVGAMVIVPKYALFLLVGMQAYALSMVYLGQYLQRQGWGRMVIWVEWLLHFLSAIGVYLGRFQRFNSWDLVTQPHDIVHDAARNLLSVNPLLLTLIAFVWIAGLYLVLKQITLALMLQQRYLRELRQRSQPLELPE